MKKFELLSPSIHSLDLRANVVIKAGTAAEQIRAMSTRLQLDPAAVIRMLALQALEKVG